MAKSRLIPKDSEEVARMCENLTPLQVRAVVAIASGKSYSEAAKELNITKKRIYFWMQKPEFAAAVLETVKEIYWETVNSAIIASEEALGVVATIMRTEGTRDRDRLDAAKIILGQGAYWKERLLISQMEKLERQLEATREGIE